MGGCNDVELRWVDIGANWERQLLGRITVFCFIFNLNTSDSLIAPIVSLCARHLSSTLKAVMQFELELNDHKSSVKFHFNGIRYMVDLSKGRAFRPSESKAHPKSSSGCA